MVMHTEKNRNRNREIKEVLLGGYPLSVCVRRA